MMQTFLGLCLALQAGASHVELHPAEAELFLESPDVPALLASYDQAPMAQLFADEEAVAALRRVLGMPQLSGEGLLKAGMSALPLPPSMQLGAYDAIFEARAASMSFLPGTAQQAPGGLLVLDWKSATTATEAAEAFASLHESMWTHADGTRVFVGGGSFTRERWSAVQAGDAPNLASLEAAGVGAARLGPDRGPVVLRGFHLRNPADLVLSALPPGDAAELDGVATVARTLFGTGAMHWRMALAGKRFVTEAFQPDATRPMEAVSWLGAEPVRTSLLDEVHSGSLLVLASTMQSDGLRDAVFAALGSAGGRSGAAVRADLEAALAVPPNDTFAKLGPGAVLFVQPIKGLGLPKSFLMMELRSPDGVLEEITAMAEALAQGVEGFKVRASKYKGVPYVTMTLPDEVASLGDLGTLRPTMTVLDGLLIVTNGSLSLKKEIRRRQGVEKDQLPPASYPWTRSTSSFPTDSTALMYVDWAAQVDGLFGMARAFGPMISQFAGDLPFDLNNLPAPTLFTRHMPATLHTKRPVEGGMYTRHSAGFAWETWVGLAGLTANVMAVFAGEAPVASGTVVVEPERPPAPEPAGNAGLDTLMVLRDLRTSLTVYKLDAGAYPGSLDGLLKSTPNYPQGFLSGARALPMDAWGRPFRYALADGGGSYRLWSMGPDGVDQDGAGDDVQDL
ncbi:MAG: type II secretion system protein GspG [Planctomycetota bacterium]